MPTKQQRVTGKKRFPLVSEVPSRLVSPGEMLMRIDAILENVCALRGSLATPYLEHQRAADEAEAFPPLMDMEDMSQRLGTTEAHLALEMGLLSPEVVAGLAKIGDEFCMGWLYSLGKAAKGKMLLAEHEVELTSLIGEAIRNHVTEREGT